MRKVLIVVRLSDQSGLKARVHDLLQGTGVEVYRILPSEGGDTILSCRMPTSAIEMLRRHPRVIRLEVEGEALPPAPTDDHGRWEDDGGRDQR